MDENPYHSATSGPPRKTRSTRWLVWSGVVCLGLALLCVVLGITGMFAAFNRIAESGATPTPSDLASGVRLAMLSMLAAVPLGLAGLGLLIAGLVFRRPVE